MSNPLSYLLLTKLKNQIKSFFKSPVKIICLIFFIAMIVVTVISGNAADAAGKVFGDIRELTAGITVFYSVMFVLMSYKGFGNGASMFSMSDVNFIFPAPFHQRKVLFYGLFQQIGASLLLGLFILFQYSWMHNAFNISYGTLLIILLGYAMTVFFAQIVAMAIYAFTSADDGKKRLVRTVYFIIIAVFAVYIAVLALGDQTQLVANAVKAVNGRLVGLFPVSGWIGSAVAGFIVGNAFNTVLGLALCAVFLIALVCLITYGKQDFYEDVLKSSEVAQSAITARKEGRIADASPSRVKVGKTGIEKGFGASVLYYKHRLENRRSRVFFLEPTRLTFAVMTIILAVFMKRAGISAIFATAVFFQIFTTALGRFNKELTKPFIYMLPEPPLKKMLFALAEVLPSTIAEALIIFIPVALIVGASPLDTVLCIVARLSYAFLITVGNIVVERLWGGSGSKMAVMLLYFAILLVMAAPGIALAVIPAILNPDAMQNATVFLALTVGNLPVSLLGLYLCRNMLQYAELNDR
ncbi:Putative ABC exporter [Sporobacter termitidis DSM 10068]|uniref:Putative ABC exporter n=1 Tax=Sporobacter termitidis DSM 10068 TaxID=1123282 RepID=A0A1M5ZBB6_9FIRM|nr:putative ABC exporter domain-containing protein [Sporobacter termitidis]SHI21510.1 Putative ABC exporter [Sporobacter termitidis DSM 10068]